MLTLAVETTARSTRGLEQGRAKLGFVATFGQREKLERSEKLGWSEPTPIAIRGRQFEGIAATRVSHATATAFSRAGTIGAYKIAAPRLGGEGTLELDCMAASPAASAVCKYAAKVSSFVSLGKLSLEVAGDTKSPNRSEQIKNECQILACIGSSKY